VELRERELLVCKRGPVVGARGDEAGTARGQAARPGGILVVHPEQRPDGGEPRAYRVRRGAIPVLLSQKPHGALLGLGARDRPVREDEDGRSVVRPTEEVRHDEDEPGLGGELRQEAAEPLIRSGIDPERCLRPDGQVGTPLGRLPGERRQVSDEVDARALEVPVPAAEEVVDGEVELRRVVARLDRRHPKRRAALARREEGHEEQCHDEGGGGERKPAFARPADEREREGVVDGHEREREGEGPGLRGQAGRRRSRLGEEERAPGAARVVLRPQEVERRPDGCGDEHDGEGRPHALGAAECKRLREPEGVEGERGERDDDEGDDEHRRVADEDRDDRVTPLVAREAEGERGHEQELQVDHDGEGKGGAAEPCAGAGEGDRGGRDERDPGEWREPDGGRREPEEDAACDGCCQDGGSEVHGTSVTAWTPSSWPRGRDGACAR